MSIPSLPLQILRMVSFIPLFFISDLSILLFSAAQVPFPGIRSYSEPFDISVLPAVFQSLVVFDSSDIEGTPNSFQ
jgi:hypothetical protein